MCVLFKEFSIMDIQADTNFTKNAIKYVNTMAGYKVHFCRLNETMKK